jgi:hypothetical protein
MRCSPVKYGLICLLLLNGCTLPARRNPAEVAEQPQMKAAPRPRWIKYEGLDGYPILKFICGVSVKVAATVGCVFICIITGSDDAMPNDLERASDDAQQAKKAEQWRADQNNKLAQQK